MLHAGVGSEFVPCNFSFYYRTAVRMQVLNLDVPAAVRAISSFSAKLASFFLTEDGIRDQPRSRGLGDVYKRQVPERSMSASKERSTSASRASHERSMSAPRALHERLKRAPRLSLIHI